LSTFQFKTLAKNFIFKLNFILCENACKVWEAMFFKLEKYKNAFLIFRLAECYFILFTNSLSASDCKENWIKRGTKVHFLQTIVL